MPAIVLKQSAPAGKVSFKKDVDQVKPDEAETVYHDHDGANHRDGLASRSPRKWYGSRKYSTSTRMERSPTSKTREGNGNQKGEWYGYEDNEDELYQYVHVDEKKFKSSDHQELSAYQVQRSLIRAKILREVVDDIYKKHYFPVTKESSRKDKKDRNKDESRIGCRLEEAGLPKNVFAMSTCISKRVKWLMDTGCGHDLIGRAKAKSLGVDIVKDDDEIVFSTSDVAR